MSQYDDDALRLSDICDGCGLMFADCDCRDEEWDSGPEPTEPPGGWKCTVCHVNAVDALNGMDTCADCLARQ